MVLGESGPLSNVKGARLTRYGANEGTAVRPGTGGGSQREIILEAGTPSPLTARGAGPRVGLYVTASSGWRHRRRNTPPRPPGAGLASS